MDLCKFGESGRGTVNNDNVASDKLSTGLLGESDLSLSPVFLRSGRRFLRSNPLYPRSSKLSTSPNLGNTDWSRRLSASEKELMDSVAPCWVSRLFSSRPCAANASRGDKSSKSDGMMDRLGRPDVGVDNGV